MANKKAASEDTLGELHNKVANVMIGILNTTEIALEAYEEASKTADVETLAVMTKPELSPSMLSAMTKFLADNSITCNPAESSSASELEHILQNKQRRKRVGNVVPLRPEDMD